MFSQSFLQMNTIFISILIESLPFVLLGVIISGVIQMFITEEMIAKVIPKNRFLAVLSATIIGALFPACECGIVPITRRLMAKGVPLHAAISFMLTGPIINPIVLFSTYIAFGNSWRMVLYRGGLSFVVALIIGFILSYQFKDSQLRNEAHDHHHHDHGRGFIGKMKGTLQHSIDEFFSVGKFLILGAFIAAAMQTFLKTSTLTAIGHGDYSSNIVMMALSYILSLCSEADAFVAASFQSTFSLNSLVAFLVFGAMFDIKNTLMMLSAFKSKFVLYLFIYVSIFVFLGSVVIGFL
ncbi:permease [Bacillus sporothermodurans]|uniref:Permease n=4 Tax=Heyndrickxia sporothermodurans TaxID=46224 RepID=A0AB37HEB0_9BACI|nr:permease [Heyndrickxia sporothermodurans]MBL5768377.1 permease [Heyndrickxia sporothermodurans]MBL5772019.1 permease [Heyndrickxia sporothermodurans]MBL5776496.1 permease [Heyndrickxia sporothermodurans]MBL5779529.1 permease [Heyndrickxia sporothermodurans]MBL5786277.1 permease [Heyndrickxia sporothermodurans]